MNTNSIEEAADKDWMNYEYRTGASLYSTCFKDGYKLGAEWQQSQPVSDKDIELLVYHLREVVFAANRMRDNYSEGDEKVKARLWTTLHTKADEARDFYEDYKDKYFFKITW